jgi:transcriptional regulator with XRE-family HTH domain
MGRHMDQTAMDPRRVIGENLRRLRGMHGLSQDALSGALQATGVLTWTQSTVADLELEHRSLRAEEAIALSLFFGVGPEQILAPQRGRVGLGPELSVDLDSLARFLAAKSAGRAARAVLPTERSVDAFSGLRRHAALTPKVLRELQEWKSVGGEPQEIIRQRDRLARGEIEPHQYAAWKRHAKARLTRGT